MMRYTVLVNKWLLGAAVLVVLGAAVVMLSGSSIFDGVNLAVADDHKDAAYLIEGERVQLEGGVAEAEAAGSGGKVVTRYFGSELAADLDGDGQEDDVAFILTQERGGSGTFFYAVAAIHTAQGYVGSDGYLLGDRIAPQVTTPSPNPRHVRVVVFNYADRAPGEPMAAQASLGKSAYLKLVPESVQWAIVEPDFEGESR